MLRDEKESHQTAVIETDDIPAPAIPLEIIDGL
jgi:hypothetical protein